MDRDLGLRTFAHAVLTMLNATLTFIRKYSYFAVRQDGAAPGPLWCVTETLRGTFARASQNIHPSHLRLKCTNWGTINNN